MKHIDLSNIPKHIAGRYKGKYDWKNSIGVKCSFTYKDIIGEVQIMEYKHIGQRLRVKYKDRELWIHTSHFKMCKLGNLIGKKTNHYKYDVADIIATQNGTIQLVEQTRVNSSKAYKYICLKCNYIGKITEGNLLLGKGCPVCCKGAKMIVNNINAIATTNPFLWSLMADIKDGYKYTENSSKHLNWKCPNCGASIVHRRIIDVNKRGLNCPCSSNYSYGEKILCNVLKELRINFEVHRKFNWSDNREYDFYIPSIKAVIEVNGVQHYTNSFESCGGRSLKEEQDNDKYKKILALKNDIKHYIIIDARKSLFEWIKNSVIDSELTIFYDTKNINWEEIKMKVNLYGFKDQLINLYI